MIANLCRYLKDNHGAQASFIKSSLSTPRMRNEKLEHVHQLIKREILSKRRKIKDLSRDERREIVWKLCFWPESTNLKRNEKIEDRKIVNWCRVPNADRSHSVTKICLSRKSSAPPSWKSRNKQFIQRASVDASGTNLLTAPVSENNLNSAKIHTHECLVFVESNWVAKQKLNWGKWSKSERINEQLRRRLKGQMFGLIKPSTYCRALLQKNWKF